MSTAAGAFICEICNMVLNCHQQYQQHRAGKKHLHKAKQKGLSYSDNVPAAKLQEAKILGQGKPIVDFVASSTDKDNTFIGGSSSGDPVKAAVVQNLLGNLPTKRKATVIGECEICSVIFNSTEQEASHMNGKKHAKKMKTAAGDGEPEAGFYCSFCDIKLNSIEQLEQHRSGLKHQKKVGSAKKQQDEARMESKLPKLQSDSEAPTLPGSVAPPPAMLLDMKN